MLLVHDWNSAKKRVCSSCVVFDYKPRYNREPWLAVRNVFGLEN
jgi:hypothetical protein